jgi:cell division protein FtsB
MWSQKQRISAVRIFLRRLGMLALLGLIAISASGVWGVYKKERESAVLRAQVERERSDLVNRHAQLEADISRLNTDRGLEEALREQFSLAEEGERLIIIVEPSISNDVAATSTFRAWLHGVFPWW